MSEDLNPPKDYDWKSDMHCIQFINVLAEIGIAWHKADIAAPATQTPPAAIAGDQASAQTDSTNNRSDEPTENNGAIETVTVRRQWNDWKKIKVPLSELRDFHIRSTSGGVSVRSPYPMLYARMWCSAIPKGAEFGHSCVHGTPPHNILVCITQVDNPKPLYKKLRAMAPKQAEH